MARATGEAARYEEWRNKACARNPSRFRAEKQPGLYQKNYDKIFAKKKEQRVENR